MTARRAADVRRDASHDCFRGLEPVDSRRPTSWIANEMGVAPSEVRRLSATSDSRAMRVKGADVVNPRPVGFDRALPVSSKRDGGLP
jgi:hypothetical protein